MIHCYDQEIEEEIKTHVKDYAEKAEIVFNELKKDFSLTKAEGAFYNFIGLPNHSKENVDNFIEKALSEKVFLIPGNIFSESTTHFRLSFATDNESLIKGCRILKDILN